MELDQETTRQVALSLAAVLVFVVALVGVGLTFGDNQGLSPTGGLAIVGLIVAFIVVMAGAGLWLSRQEFD